MRNRVSLVVSCLFVLALVACGSSSSKSGAPSNASSTTAASTGTSKPATPSTTASVPAGCTDLGPRDANGAPGFVLQKYTSGYADAHGIKCIATTPGPLLVCSTGGATPAAIPFTIDGKSYVTGSTTCKAGVSTVTVATGTHTITSSADPKLALKIVVS